MPGSMSPAGILLMEVICLLLAPSMQTVAQLTWDHFRDSQAVRYEDVVCTCTSDLQHVGGRMP